MTTMTDKPTSSLNREGANALTLEAHHGPKFFKPTHLHFTDQDGNKVEWQSRRARKGRYPVKTQTLQKPNGELAEVRMRMATLESELQPHLKGDVSFWIAVSFTVGSAIWVANGLLSYLPLVRPDLGSEEKMNTAAAGVGFLGGIIFEIGSYLMVVEALDRGRETNMGTAMYRLFARLRNRLEDEVVPHNQAHAEAGTGAGDYWPANKKGFTWWGKPLWHDMGYFAAFTQLVAASVFWIATLTALPGVIPGKAEGKLVAVTDVFFWAPQVVGGCGFILSSSILMTEVQHKWWLPRPLDIGWQVGFWNLIGSIGFTACGALGFSSNSKVEYQSTLSSFWGSCAFLIGSCCQLYEVLWRAP